MHAEPSKRSAELLRSFARLKRRLWLRRLLRVLMVITLVTAALALAGLKALLITTIAALSGILLVLVLLFRPEYQQLTAARFARHLDRRFPQLEESSILLLADAEELSTMQTMQARRTGAALKDCLAQETRWLPPLRPALPVTVIITCALLTLIAPQLRDWAAASVSALTPGGLQDVTSENHLGEHHLGGAEVLITPPAYTGLEAVESRHMDLDLIEGSEVRWRLQIEGPNAQFSLHFTDDESLKLQVLGDGGYGGTRMIDQTGLYRVVSLREELSQDLDGIHTLTVRRDQAPEIRIESPAQTTLEIPMNAAPLFESLVSISDDFGIDQVEILASVAKGSGEGVKFRDESFTFDSTNTDGDKTLYRRGWNLAELGMEPGDEVYFFVTARDNREPEPNFGRSETVIVRWLDEDESAVATEGLAIDVMPEYFKSQRQIIIETEQLISDRGALDKPEFDSLSRALGQAQSDLKQRYGQYLGDEFAEEEGEVHEHESDDAGGHDGEGAEAPALDTSGTARELIARFGHDHGAAEIGPITARNPVGMMKRSISNMWQAELHLLLSEPEKALPFEYEALKYLNLARAADRIYTRRLGFEPPPVSEETRLTGDLNEILEYQRVEKTQAEEADGRFFMRLYQLLNEPRGAASFTGKEVDLLNEASQRITELSQERPALIKQAATVELLLANGGLSLPDCASCMQGLRDTIWSLLPEAESEPQSGPAVGNADDDMAREYLRISSQEAQP